MTSFTDVSGVDPALNSGFSGRISWIQAYDGIGYVAILNLDSVNGYFYNIRIVDTTLYNPRWSTWSGFGSTWGFNNTTGASISGTFSIYDGSGSVLKTVSVTVPAGKAKFYSSGPSDLNLPNNIAGSAMFAYVGPPGALQVDAYMLNGSGTVVIPTKFEPRNAQW